MHTNRLYEYRYYTAGCTAFQSYPGEAAEEEEVQGRAEQSHASSCR